MYVMDLRYCQIIALVLISIPLYFVSFQKSQSLSTSPAPASLLLPLSWTSPLTLNQVNSLLALLRVHIRIMPWRAHKCVAIWSCSSSASIPHPLIWKSSAVSLWQIKLEWPSRNLHTRKTTCWKPGTFINIPMHDHHICTYIRTYVHTYVHMYIVRIDPQFRALHLMWVASRGYVLGN